MSDLSDGYVPTARILATLEPILGEEGWSDENDHLRPLTRYWEVLDVRKMMQREYIAFDFADKVLCLLGLQAAWWVELADVYYAVNLAARPSRHRTAEKDVRRCARDGCSNTFTLKPRGSHKKFCSSYCKTVAFRVERGLQPRPSESADVRTGGFVCRKGHERTPENTGHGINSNGRPYRRCLVCRAESRRAA